MVEKNNQYNSETFIKQKIPVFLPGLILLPLLGSNQGPSD